MYRGGLTGKFKPNRFLKTRFLLTGFYCSSLLVCCPICFFLDEPYFAEVAFALDFSASSVSDDDLKIQIEFVKQLTENWKIPERLIQPVKTMVVYGSCTHTVPFNVTDDSSSVQSYLLPRETESKCRRMDLAIKLAADSFSEDSKSEHRIVVLIAAGRQLSENENLDDDLLRSVSEELSARKIETIILPVGIGTDFRSLGLLINRPQSLHPLSSFDEMTANAAENIARFIRETLGGIFLYIFYLIIS